MVPQLRPAIAVEMPNSEDGIDSLRRQFHFLSSLLSRNPLIHWQSFCFSSQQRML